MIHHRSRAEVKKFDIIKLIILIILILLLIPLWPFGRRGGGPEASKGEAAIGPAAPSEGGTTTAAQPEATAPPTEVPATATPAATATPEPAVEVAAPTLDPPAAPLSPGPVELTGTGEPGSRVELVIDGKVVGQAAVGSDGKWKIATELAEPGNYQVSVQMVDAGGKVLAASEQITMSVVAPVAAATQELAVPTEESAPTSESPAEATAEATAPTLDVPVGSLTAGQVELTGTGEPGSEVEVAIDGQVVGTTTVDADGKWSLEVDLPEAKEYEVTVQAVDAEGKVLAESEAAVVAVVTPVPTEEAAAQVTAPTLNVPGDSLTAGKVELTGTGEPGSEVEVVVNGRVVGKTTVGADGKWSLEVDLPEAKEYEVTVQAVDADGKVLAESEAAVVAVVAPAPTLDVPVGSLAVGQVELTGTGEPGSEVEVVVDGQVVGKTTVDADGKWSLEVDLPEAKEYEVTVQAVDAGGKVLAESEAVSLKAAESEETTPAPAEPDGQVYVVQADDWLSKLALKFYEDMMAYPIIIDATNAKAKEDSSFTPITNPDLIEIGQKLWIPATAE